MASRPERVIGHTGTGDTAQTPTEAAVGNLRQWTKVWTEQRRVSEEGFRIVKLCVREGEQRTVSN